MRAISRFMDEDAAGARLTNRHWAHRPGSREVKFDPERARLWRKEVRKEMRRKFRKRMIARWRAMSDDDRRAKVAEFWAGRRQSRLRASLGNPRIVKAANIVRCKELPGRMWASVGAMKSDLNLPASESAIKLGIRDHRECCGYHFYRGDQMPEFKEARNRIPVQNTKTGQIFPSITDAVEAMTGFVRGTVEHANQCHYISGSCDRKDGRRRAMGVVWRRLRPKRGTAESRQRNVLRRPVANDVGDEFPTVRAAAEWAGVTPPMLSSAIRRGHRSGGHSWYYLEKKLAAA